MKTGPGYGCPNDHHHRVERQNCTPLPALRALARVIVQHDNPRAAPARDKSRNQHHNNPHVVSTPRHQQGR